MYYFSRRITRVHSDLGHKKTKRVIRNRVPFLNRKPHTKYMGPDPHTKSMTHTICVKCHTKCMGVTQNVWAPYLTMRHFLLESFVWEAANRVPFLIRDFSYDRDPSVALQELLYCQLLSTTVQSLECLPYTYILGEGVSLRPRSVKNPNPNPNPNL